MARECLILDGLRHTLRREPSSILLGTSSFTASGWEGSFYPKGMRSADYLAFYAEHFYTVEVDSTFYACPSARRPKFHLSMLVVRNSCGASY
jgi:hypothetical protein